jgi:hypothetical protein
MNDQWKEGDTHKDCFTVAKNDVVMDKIVKSLGQSSTSERLVILQLSRVAIEKKDYDPKPYEKLNDKKNVDKVREELDEMKCSKLQVDLLLGIKKAQEIAANHAASRITLHVISDFRQRDWSGPEGEALQKALITMTDSPDVKIRLFDTSYPARQTGGGVPLSHDNVGILDLRPGTRVAGKDMPVNFTVTLANYSSREAAVNVAIYDDATGQEMLQVDFNPPMPLKIAPGSLATASFELRFNPQIKANETYFAQISARLESAQRGKLENDGLADDDVRHAAVEIRDKVPVLVIDGEGKRGREENNDSFFIRNAIISVPGASYEIVHGDELGGGVGAKALERSDLLQYPTIFMLNVRELNDKQLANLENYVREGGGVAFFLGPQVSANYYNKKLYAGGKGVFPVPLRDTYHPPANEDALKPEVTGDDHILLRDELFPSIETFPIFGAVFKDREQRYFLKNLPIKRYFPVPRSQWRPEPGRVDELATLPNEQPITTYQRAALEIVQGQLMKKILENEEYKEYTRGLERHRKTIETLVGPTSEKKLFHLASALDALLNDKGKEKERADYPNLTEFWANSDPKIRSLREDVTKLIEQARYGDPFVVRGLYGKGKVVAVMTTAGKEWNDWGGGSDASFIYQPFIWELQNYLSSQGSEANLTVGTPVQLVVDGEQYKQKVNRQLKMIRQYQKAELGKPAKLVKAPESEQQVPPSDKGVLTYSFEKSLLPGLYITTLHFEDAPEGKAPLASWGHVYNVDTQREGKLQRVSFEDIDKNVLREARRQGAIRFEHAQATGDDLVNRQTDWSESPWFFLIFLSILVAEQALAVHLSFHLRGGEGELPAQVVKSSQPAAAA